MSSPAAAKENIVIRPAQPADAERCGAIAYEAFRDIATRHSFTPDFPSPEVAVGLLRMLFSHPRFYSVVAEINGKIVGSNCLDERALVSGVGPVTVDPRTQNGGIGRLLMQAVMKRAAESTPAGVRLVQAAYHLRSLSLYTKLGFDAQEFLAVINGDLKPRATPGYPVRPACEADVPACNALCHDRHGLERGNELRDGIRDGSAFVVERGGRITGYASGLGFFGHAVAETNEDLQALIASARMFIGPGILVPIRNAELFRWCLQQGLRAVFTGTLMSKGIYQQPRGPWLPSILY